MVNMTPWKAIASALAAEGIERIYGMPGNPMHLVADIAESTAIDVVLTRHEHSGVACAFAAARITRSPQVAFGNPGPGITNLATGLLEAHSASLPVIALANGVPLASDGRGAFQELDSVDHLRPVTKWSTRIVDPASTPWVMARAFAIAQAGRPGPVFIDVPSDIGLVAVAMEEYRPALGRRRSRPDSEDVTAAAALIARARRPILWCGSGAYSADAGAQVAALAERLGAAVFTTPGGRGVIAESHPHAMGQTGLYFTAGGKAWFDEADLVISIGSRLEEFSTGGWMYWPSGAGFIQIDNDPHAIALNMRPDVALVGDAALALDDLIAALPDLDGVAARTGQLTQASASWVAEVDTDRVRQESPILTRQVMGAINKVFGNDTVMVHENGGAYLWSYYWPYYRVLDAGYDVPMGEQTAMGMGVIGTIGVKLSCPDKKVVCVTGDGACQMAMMEFATAAEQRCGVTWVVLNNRAFGWPQYGQILNNKQQVATDFLVAADLVAIARAQGCEAIAVKRPEEVEPALRAALAANAVGRPCLIDIAIAKHDYPDHFVAHHKATMSGG